MRRDPSPWMPTLATIGAHVLLFIATGLLIRYGSHPDLGAATWSCQIYYDYASQAMGGKIPYWDFLVEYPILSFPLFLAPRLVAPSFPAYCVAFGAEMLLFDVATIVLIARRTAAIEGASHVGERLAWYTVFCASLAPLVVGRFELAPMFLGFASATWWFSGQAALGGFAAGLGALLKIFPGFVALLAGLREVSTLRASRARGSLVFAVTVTLGVAGWFSLGGLHVLDSFRYHAERGLGIETLYSGALLAWGMLTGVEVPWVIEHKAIHIVPEWGSRLASMASPLQLAALLLVLWAYWRAKMSEGIRYGGAAILASIVMAKVLSPQFLIWLFPFIATLGGWTGSRARWIFLLTCLTTALIYPGPAFAQILDHQVVAIFLLNLRNMLLVALLALLLFGPPETIPGPLPSKRTSDRVLSMDGLARQAANASAGKGM